MEAITDRISSDAITFTSLNDKYLIISERIYECQYNGNPGEGIEKPESQITLGTLVNSLKGILTVPETYALITEYIEEAKKERGHLPNTFDYYAPTQYPQKTLILTRAGLVYELVGYKSRFKKVICAVHKIEEYNKDGIPQIRTVLANQRLVEIGRWSIHGRLFRDNLELETYIHNINRNTARSIRDKVIKFLFKARVQMYSRATR